MSTDSVQEKNVQNQPEESQTTEAATVSSRAIQRAISVVIGVLLFVGAVAWGVSAMTTSDPYVRNVLEISGNAARGHDIFQLNCAVCHGLEADGEVGPNLHEVSARKSRVALIEQVISGQTPPMPQFQPSEKDMADLLSFLETL